MRVPESARVRLSSQMPRIRAPYSRKLRSHLRISRCSSQIQHCPRLPRPTSTTVIAPEPTHTECVCEEVFCILSFPEGCYCQNDAKKACFEKCGGEKPTYQDCTIPIDAVKARAPEPEPVPEAVPAPVPAPQDETCVCEEVFCILSWPQGCYCRNDAKKACFEKCGGEEPTYDDCTVDIVNPQPAPTSTPVPLPEPICVCEDVVCIQSIPESCLCRNAADKACFEKCGGEEPTYQDCSIDVAPRAPEPVPEPKPEPEAEACTCSAIFCPQIWPESCWCAYDGAVACAEKCGNPLPVDTCPPRPIEARKAEPEPVPEPVPEPQDETCECEPVVCIALWPQSCWCFYNAEVECAAKCGKPAPPPSTCPPIPVEARVAEPEPVPAPIPPPECECPLVNCISTQPELCECLNASAQRCYELCGGKKPVPQVCLPDPSTTFSTSIIPLPTPVNPRQATPTNQICGGGRGSPLQECPAGQTCITDPFTPGSCGPACDMLGICVSEKLCGGFAGFECDTPGQICVDDPRDDCDPSNGGSDCGGLCAWPQ
ncbi:hypothetical protein BKA58DRAFT_95623 [Alternaria rosae]|uniref:uncharacterized protein n=1 Tax=Alternaria rosae TaxID=1187941 RepID=UPI001E8E8FD9|nr:uncharacterized protein BKA58DRAFT_95623 [Alternaria rosae]KAH6878432.1 hypothetical protein BKA58DRAFT_95623 [Alternaria rosae]